MHNSMLISYECFLSHFPSRLLSLSLRSPSCLDLLPLELCLWEPYPPDWPSNADTSSGSPMLLVSPEPLLPSTFSSYMLPVSSCRSRDCKIVGGCPENVRDPERTIVGEGAIDELVEGISGCKLPLPALVLPSLPDLPFSLSRNLSLGRLQDEKPTKAPWSK